MEFEEYKGSVTTRIRALSQEEYNMLTNLAQQPVSEIIFSVLGEDMTNTIVTAMTPPAVQETAGQAQPTPEVRRPGLGAR